MSSSRWVEEYNVIGIVSKQGKNGGTYAHQDIAFKFASWISAEFEFYLIKEFQRLKAEEQKELEWSAKREIAKLNYRIHTDAIKENIVPTLSEKQINFVYANEADLLNVALFGKTASDWRKENPELDLPDLKKWLSYCKTREQDNQQEYEWALNPDGNHKLKIFGTAQDKEMVDAYLAKNVDKIWSLSKKGVNPNIPVTYLKLGDRAFPEKEQAKFGVVEETTLPMLSQLIVRSKNVKNPQAQISFINDCIDCGARFITAGNQYVMPEDCLEQINSPEVKEHVEEISSIAKESEQEYVESGKKLTTDGLHSHIQQNIQAHIQGQALQSEDN